MRRGWGPVLRSAGGAPGAAGPLTTRRLADFAAWVPGDAAAIVRAYPVPAVTGGYEPARTRLRAMPDSMLLELEELAEVLRARFHHLGQSVPDVLAAYAADHGYPLCIADPETNLFPLVGKSQR